MARALGRHELDAPAEQRLQEIAKVDEVRERLLLGLELHEQVDITVRACHIASDRPDERTTAHAQADDLGPDGLDAVLHIGARGSLGCQRPNLARTTGGPKAARATAVT